MLITVRIEVSFYSYFKELTGCSATTEEVPEDATLDQLLQRLYQRFPKLAPMAKATLIAVGVEYQPRSYLLRPGDQVSLFPPVQGG